MVETWNTAEPSQERPAFQNQKHLTAVLSANGGATCYKEQLLFHTVQGDSVVFFLNKWK